MEPAPETTTETFALRNDVTWRIFLGVLFGLALLVRYLVYMDVMERPLGQFERWPGTEGWLLSLVAQETVERETWLIPGPNILMKAEMLRAAPGDFWKLWTGERLPRGGIIYYIAAASHALSGGLALYSIMGLLAGALVPVFIAVAGGHLFGDRRAGALAGLVAASHHTLVVASVVPGPWIWEALVFAAIMAQVFRIGRGVANPAEWALLGILTGIGLWLRPLFGWGIPLAAILLWRLRPAETPWCLIAMVVPLLLIAGGLAGRNAAAGGSPLPSVGQPAWDFLETTNPAARFRPTVPANMVLMETSEGAFLPLAVTAFRDGQFRAGLPPVMLRKIREFAGGRDVADTLCPAYIRLRVEVLRWTTIEPLAAMAFAWGALLFLLGRRRLPWQLAVLLGLLTLHALFFRTDGMDRTLLHVAASLLTGGALAIAGSDLRHQRTGHAMMLAMAWSVCLYLLLIDDHARGSRYRAWEFAQAQRIHLERNERQLARAEGLYYQQIRRQEVLTQGYWNVNR